MPEIISRKEARARGLKRYFTGLPCKYGHIEERHTKGTCLACGRRQVREWAKRHRDRINKYKSLRCAEGKGTEANRIRCLRYKKKNAERIREYQRDWQREKRQKHRDKLTEYRRRVYAADPQKYRDYAKRYSREGPKNPKGELQWLRKNQAQLRALKRTLRASASPSEASTQGPNSQA